MRAHLCSACCAPRPLQRSQRGCVTSKPPACRCPPAFVYLPVSLPAFLLTGQPTRLSACPPARLPAVCRPFFNDRCCPALSADGALVTVHFDCKYRSIVAARARPSALLPPLSSALLLHRERTLTPFTALLLPVGSASYPPSCNPIVPVVPARGARACGTSDASGTSGASGTRDTGQPFSFCSALSASLLVARGGAPEAAAALPPAPRRRRSACLHLCSRTRVCASSPLAMSRGPV